MSLLSSVSSSSVPSSASQWREVLGFVPTPAARAAATPEKVAFLVMVKEANPLVSNSFVQTALLEEISPICFKLKGYTITWLARELGNQFLTLSTKQVRESVKTFAVYTLNQISEKDLSGISIKGKKKRFRDWRDIVFTTVLETPVVEYNISSIPLPEGYQIIGSNHELLKAADEFGNCSFSFSGRNSFLQGTEGIIISQDPNPVMIHFKYNYSDGLFSLLQVQHKENVSPTSIQIEQHRTRLNEKYYRKKKEEEEKEKEKEKEKELRETIKNTIVFFGFSLIAAAFLATASLSIMSIVYNNNNIERHK